MLKKTCMIMILLSLFGIQAYSQAQQKKVLSKSDVDNYVKNYEKIQEIMEEYSEEIESFVDPSEEDSFKSAIKLRNASVSRNLQNELSKLGLGNNGFEKVIVLMFGTSVMFIEQMMPPEAAGDAMQNEMMAEIKAIKSAINSEDYNLIKTNSENLMELMNFF